MGAEAALAFSAVSGVASGIGGLAAANTAANPYQTTVNPLQGALNAQQAAITQQEAAYNQQATQALSEANLNAQQEARQAETTIGQQNEAYNNAGVMQSGTPMEVAAYSAWQGQQEVNATVQRGQAQANLANTNAYITGAQGAAQLFGAQSNFITQQATAKIQAGQTAQVMRNAAIQSLSTATAKGIDFTGSTDWYQNNFGPASNQQMPPVAPAYIGGLPGAQT